VARRSIGRRSRWTARPEGAGSGARHRWVSAWKCRPRHRGWDWTHGAVEPVRPAFKSTRSGADDSGEGVVVTVQTGAEIVDLGKIKGLAGLAGDRIDQVILMRIKGMSLQPIELIVPKRSQDSIAFSICNGNILHVGFVSRDWLRDIEKQPLCGAVSLGVVSEF